MRIQPASLTCFVGVAIGVAADEEHITVKSRAQLGAQPFDEVGAHVKSIAYKDEKAFSIKLKGIYDEGNSFQEARARRSVSKHRQVRSGRRTIWEKIKFSLMPFGIGEGDTT